MVFTNEKCVGCNKCIRSCPVLTANVAEDEKINVNEDIVFNVEHVLIIVDMVQEILMMIQKIF